MSWAGGSSSGDPRWPLVSPALPSSPRTRKTRPQSAGGVKVVRQPLVIEYTPRGPRAGYVSARWTDGRLTVDPRLSGPPAATAVVPPRAKRRLADSVFYRIFRERRFPEPLHYHNVDCMGIPSFLRPSECGQIIRVAEQIGWRRAFKPGLQDELQCEITDPHFAEALWHTCGLEWLFRSTVVDGLVPFGLNDVLRVQRYSPGCFTGRHIDRPIRREDGRISLYSLRVFLNNGQDGGLLPRHDVDVLDEEADEPCQGDFTGGLSVFHVPFKRDPVVFEPEMGLALLYPQGELCTLQEELEVMNGVKYILRADVLFGRSVHLDRF